MLEEEQFSCSKTSNSRVRKRALLVFEEEQFSCSRKSIRRVRGRAFVVLEEKQFARPKNFKRPKNREESSDLDENLSETIAAMKTIICKRVRSRQASKNMVSKIFSRQLLFEYLSLSLGWVNTAVGPELCKTLWQVATVSLSRLLYKRASKCK